jgi:hypothetical protein
MPVNRSLGLQFRGSTMRTLRIGNYSFAPV